MHQPLLRVRADDPLEGHKDRRVIGDNRRAPDLLGLVHDRLGQIDRAEHRAGKLARRLAHEQAHVVPGFGERERGEFTQSLEQLGTIHDEPPYRS